MQNIDQHLLESITNSQKNSVFHEGFDSIIRFLNASTFYGLLTPCTNFGVWLYHKSKVVREYVESAGGDVELEFLPPYTPQLNPVEIVWRDLKKRLAGRFFRSLDELKAAITAILEREMGNRLKGYLVA